jgi:acyl dehydratase
MSVRHFQQLPKPYLAYPKIIKGLMQKKPKATALPELEYVVDALKIERKHLNTYQSLTGFAQNQHVPALYFAVLAQSLQMQMMSLPEFPFQVLGLVHVANQIEQQRIIDCNEIFRLSCKFGELKPHEKGMVFDFIIEVKVQDQVVMRGTSRYLAKQKGTVVEKAKPSPSPVYLLKDEWQVAEHTGRHYALNSGDFNLIHLHRLTAKAFGFKRAIAHGMWSKAQILSRLDLPDAYRVEVEFKLPIYLPSRVELLTAENGKIEFLLRNTQDQKPHLVGVVETI